jgi:hypothetical protein
MRPGDHSLITVRDIIAECITVRDIIVECAEMITVDGVDHWLFNDNYASYSRFYSGGVYQCAFGFGRDGMMLWIRPIFRSGWRRQEITHDGSFGWKYDDEIRVSLFDPDSFPKIGAIIRKIVDKMQPDRLKRW